MNPDVKNLIDHIQQSDFSQDEKDFIVQTLSNDALSPEQKGGLLEGFFATRYDQLQEQEASLVDTIIKAGQQELEQANASLESSMAELDTEAGKL